MNMSFLDMKSVPVKKVPVHDITIAYRDFGEGEPFVLINGFGSTMDMWNPPILSSLAAHYRVIIFDNRGTGYTGSSDTPFSIPLFANDSFRLMDALKITRAHILGFSMGASIAQEMVLTCPERVRKLILISGDCGGPQAVRMPTEIWRELSDKSGTLLEQANRMFALIFPREWLLEHPDPFSYCPEVCEITSEESTARQGAAFLSWEGSYNRLPDIRAPTLILTGTDDVIIPARNSIILGERIRGAWIVQFRNGGHGLMYQYPDQFSRVVLMFLELAF
jgi:pimeloyl-ACP methyl ester carboxylesterase